MLKREISKTDNHLAHALAMCAHAMSGNRAHCAEKLRRLITQIKATPSPTVKHSPSSLPPLPNPVQGNASDADVRPARVSEHGSNPEKTKSRKRKREREKCVESEEKQRGGLLVRAESAKRLAF